jgi:hypothetical protein
VRQLAAARPVLLLPLGVLLRMHLLLRPLPLPAVPHTIGGPPHTRCC